MKTFILSIKKGFGEYTSLIIKANNRLEAYNQVIEIRAGKILSIKEI